MASVERITEIQVESVRRHREALVSNQLGTTLLAWLLGLSAIAVRHWWRGMSGRQTLVLVAGTILTATAVVFRPSVMFSCGVFGCIVDVVWYPLALSTAVEASMIAAAVLAVGWVERWAGLK